MKIHLRIFSIISAFIMITGCSKAESSSSNINAVANIKASNINFYKTSDMVYEDGLIWFDGSKNTVSWLDFETMESVVLCSKPNCTHNNSECIARRVGDCPVIYNGYIYFMESDENVIETPDGRKLELDSRLNRISLENSELEEVCSFNDCSVRNGNGCVLAGSTLYFCGDDMDPVQDEYGNLWTSTSGGIHSLCSVDLETGKYTNYGSIYDGDKQFEAASNSSGASIVGFGDSKLDVMYSFMKEFVQFEGSDIDERDVFTIMNFEFDLNTHELRQSELPPPSYARGDAYLCSNYPDNSSTLIRNSEETTIEGLDVDMSGKFANDKIFMSDGWYDLDGVRHDMGRYTGWQFVTLYKKEYVFYQNREFVKLTEDELLSLEK